MYWGGSWHQWSSMSKLSNSTVQPHFCLAFVEAWQQRGDGGRLSFLYLSHSSPSFLCLPGLSADAESASRVLLPAYSGDHTPPSRAVLLSSSHPSLCCPTDAHPISPTSLVARVCRPLLNQYPAVSNSDSCTASLLTFG